MNGFKLVPKGDRFRENAEELLLEALARVRSGRTDAVVIVEDIGSEVHYSSSGCRSVHEIAGKLEGLKLRILGVGE